MALSRLFTTQLEKPYSNCNLKEAKFDSFDSDLYKTLFKLNKSYSQKDCYDLCYQQQVILACNCSDLNFLPLPNTRSCLSVEDVICLYTVYENFGTKNINDLCDYQCPLECVSESFVYKTAQSIYPSYLYASLLNRHPVIIKNYNNQTVSQDTLRKSLLKLNVYYEDLSYISITEMPTLNGISLISNIGGTLGLFLGINTFLHRFVIIIIIIIIIIIKSFQNIVFIFYLNLNVYQGFSFLSMIEFIELIIEIVLIGGFNSTTNNNDDQNSPSSSHSSSTTKINDDTRLFHLSHTINHNNNNNDDLHNKRYNKGRFRLFRNDKKIIVR